MIDSYIYIIDDLIFFCTGLLLLYLFVMAVASHCKHITYPTEAFCEQGEFRRNVDALIDEIKNVKLEAGTDEVLMPGEIEFRAEIANRKKGGVPIQPFQISELNEQAAPFGFTFEEYL